MEYAPPPAARLLVVGELAIIQCSWVSMGNRVLLAFSCARVFLWRNVVCCTSTSSVFRIWSRRTLNRALGLPFQEPEWFHLPVMRRIAISTPNVMTALRRLRREQ